MIRAEFRLIPIGELLEHEEVDPELVERIRARIESSGTVEEPIWVAAGSQVVLNGHHRYRALRALGARRVPAWVLDYEDPGVRLDRWSVGPPITKAEVLRRAEEHRLFPPKTTRHTLAGSLPVRATSLAALEGGAMPARRSLGSSRATNR